MRLQRFPEALPKGWTSGLKPLSQAEEANAASAAATSMLANSFKPDDVEAEAALTIIFSASSTTAEFTNDPSLVARKEVSSALPSRPRT